VSVWTISNETQRTAFIERRGKFLYDCKKAKKESHFAGYE